MNKVILIGRLVRDPDCKTYNTQNGTGVLARFTLACDRRFKRDEQAADFIPCKALGKSGEFVERFCKKGTKIAVEGSIQTGSYTNNDGNKVYTTDVLVERMEFAESKSSSGNAGSDQNSQSSPSSSTPDAGSDGFMNIPDGIDEELPFN